MLQAVEPKQMGRAEEVRILSLSAAATETICALGLQSALVGRLHECRGPPSILALPCVSCTKVEPKRISSFETNGEVLIQSTLARYDINWNLLRELKPDLMFIDDQPNVIEVNLGIVEVASQGVVFGENKTCKVISLQSHTVEDVFRNLWTIANSCGVKERGEKLCHEFQGQLRIIKQRTPQWSDGMPPVSVACLRLINPMTAAGYWVPEIVSCAGGISLFGGVSCPDIPVTWGDLLQGDPDVIVVFCHGFNINGRPREVSWLENSKEWHHMRAVRAKRVFLVNTDRYFIDSGPNVVLSAEIMAEILHGFRFGHESEGFIRWEAEVSLWSDGSEDFQKVVVAEDQSRERLKVPLSSSYQEDSDVECNLRRSKLSEGTRHGISNGYPKYAWNAYESSATVAASNVELNLFQNKDKLWSTETGCLEKMNSDTYSRCKNPEAETEVTKFSTSLESGSKILMSSEDVVQNGQMSSWENHRKMLQRPSGEEFQISRNVHVVNGLEEMQPSVNSYHLDKAPKILPEDRQVPPSRQSEEYTTQLFETQPLLQTISVVKSHDSPHKTFPATVRPFHEKHLLSKMWQFTGAASKAKAMDSSASSPHNKMFYKRECLPGRIEHAAWKTVEVNALDKISKLNKWNSLPGRSGRSSADFMPSENTDLQVKTSTKLARHKVPFERERAREHVSPLTECYKHVSPRVGANSNSLSFEKQCTRGSAQSKKALVLRSLILSVLKEFIPANCLLFSGGLASGVLAEAASLVSKGGFKVAVTVAAGPMATDKAYAEAVAKHCRMKHVVIGDGGKGNAFALLEQELDFVVQTLNTFDPIQVRSSVAIAAALREAKHQGFKSVVTGHGADEIFTGGISLQTNSDVKEGVPLQVSSRHLCSSAKSLGAALGIKVLQPFLHPEILKFSAALNNADLVGLGKGEILYDKLILREAFPEMVSAWRKKDPIEVGCGTSILPEYFTKHVSAGYLEKKTDRIYRKERIHIRDAEHLGCYFSFRRVLKKKTSGSVRWGSDPCSGCGYQLQPDMRTLCFVCGQYPACSDLNVEKPKDVGQDAKGILASPNLNQEECQHGIKVKVTEVNKFSADLDFKNNGKPSPTPKKREASLIKSRDKYGNVGTRVSVKGTSKGSRIKKRHSVDKHLQVTNSRQGMNGLLWSLGAGSAVLLILLRALKQ